MSSSFTGVAFLVLQLIAFSDFAQKKIAVLGSSTAYGNGASIVDSSWVGRLQASVRKNVSDGVDTVIDNRAMPGYVTYQSLPTGYSVPAGRPSPDELRNVTYILNDRPRANIVIINYPTNDIVNGYNPKEMMDNLRLMFQQFSSNGITCYITTTQPRNTATDAQRTLLRQLVDSIQNNFGTYAINFWDDLVTSDGTNMLRPEVNSDETHPNDVGHRLLFQRVQGKNIFSAVVEAPLPLTLKNWQVRLEDKMVKINWSTAHEELNTFFEIQRSVNGKDFQTLYKNRGTGHAADYSWTDTTPFDDKNFYRLKIIEPGKISYSRIILITNGKQELVTGLYADGSKLHIQLNSSNSYSLVVAIISYSGAIVKQQGFEFNGSGNTFTMPISELASGHYFVRIITSEGPISIKRFFRIK